MTSPYCLVLRLAGPMQSWGIRSQFNRRETNNEPTKSGIAGLLAAALGRRRIEPIEDLLGLRLGVRTDYAGSLLRDYHTVSDYRGVPLLSAAVTGKGVQKSTSPPKYTHVTQRYYLQDAAFVAAIGGPTDLLATLAAAVRAPAFPLALGRRACVPTQPLLLTHPAPAEDQPRELWPGRPAAVLADVPWQAPQWRAERLRATNIDLPVTVDTDEFVRGDVDVRLDVPRSFDPLNRGFSARLVQYLWVSVPTGRTGDRESTVDGPGGADPGDDGHDPFALLGW